MYALTNCHIYTGEQQIEKYSVVIQDDQISHLCEQNDIPKGIESHDLNGAILAPGFIDLQLNGCGGVQFNETLDSLRVETLDKMHKTNLQSGCTSFLPTLITSNDEFMVAAVNVMREYLKSHQNNALGLHLEGPYINIEKKGIHDPRFIREPSPKMINFLCDNADVIKMITLAPEKVESRFIRQLVSAGIDVAVGHSNGSYADCKRGFDEGISFATHLFNAMPYITGREPGLVGAIYDYPNIYAGIIADGHHVHWANIRNSQKIKRDHLVLVTDAMLLAQSNLTSAIFAGKTIYNKNGLCVDDNGSLGGSSLTMINAIKNVVNHAGIELDEALRMATLYPARAIGVDNKLGRIHAGYIANLVVFTQDFEIVKTVVNGQMDS